MFDARGKQKTPGKEVDVHTPWFSAHNLHGSTATRAFAICRTSPTSRLQQLWASTKQAVQAGALPLLTASQAQSSLASSTPLPRKVCKTSVYSSASDKAPKWTTQHPCTSLAAGKRCFNEELQMAVSINFEVLLAGALITRSLLFRVCIRFPDPWKLLYHCLSGTLPEGTGAEVEKCSIRYPRSSA